MCRTRRNTTPVLWSWVGRRSDPDPDTQGEGQRTDLTDIPGVPGCCVPCVTHRGSSIAISRPVGDPLSRM